RPYREGKSFQLVDGTFPRDLDYQDFVALDNLKNQEGKPVTFTTGTVLEYWLEALDNCDYPQANRGESQHFKVTLTDSLPPQEKKQQQEQAAQKKKEHEDKQDQKLADENRQRQNQENNQPNNGKDEPKPSN